MTLVHSNLTHKGTRRLPLCSQYIKHENETESQGVKKEKKKDVFTPTECDIQKFQRHEQINLKTEKNLKRRRHLERQQRINDEAVRRLAAFNCLLTETSGFLEVEPHEKSFTLKQKDILQHLDIESRAKAWKIDLTGGPFLIDFTKNGRYLLSGGHRYGNLSIIDCLSLHAITEVHVNETIRDLCFLHNETMWAAAQKKYVFLYDNHGIELHCLREHMMTYRMEFLPHHYLLTTIGEFGELRYLDISTGLVAANHKTTRGPCDTMCQNPFTGVINLGHAKGTISMWTPNVGKPVVEFLSHGGKVMSLCHLEANYLASAGLDGCCKLWDIRRFQHVHSFRYFGPPPKTMDASQNGMILGVGFGSHVQFWKDLKMSAKPKMPYLTHEVPGNSVHSLKFRPYEDFSFLGLTSGIESVVVPGSGLANFHSHTADPYETTKQRQEREIHSLLDKLPAETITYDPSKLGMIDDTPRTVSVKDEEASQLEVKPEKEKKTKRRSLKKVSTVAREKHQKKLYADLMRKKRQKRLREEALNAMKPHTDGRNDQESVCSIQPREPTSHTVKKEAFDCLQRFRKKRTN